MMPAEFDIAGKVVFITGAGRGIGKGIAQVLAEAGADVALNALTPKYVEGVAADIAASSGRRVVPVIADVTTTDGAQRAVDSVLSTFGRIIRPACRPCDRRRDNHGRRSAGRRPSVQHIRPHRCSCECVGRLYS